MSYTIMIITIKNLLKEQEWKAKQREEDDRDAFLNVLIPILEHNVRERRKEEYRKHRNEIWKGCVNEALTRAGHAMRVL